MTSKLIPAMIVEDNCYTCSYCKYDPDYGMSYDSGYDCDHDHGRGRIANDGQLRDYHKKFREYEKSLETLFPLPNPTDENPMTIPKWCPLEDVK